MHFFYSLLNKNLVKYFKFVIYFLIQKSEQLKRSYVYMSYFALKFPRLSVDAVVHFSTIMNTSDARINQCALKMTIVNIAIRTGATGIVTLQVQSKNSQYINTISCYIPDRVYLTSRFMHCLSELH